MIISVQKTNQLKSIAILMMLCLHLFNRDYNGVFQPLVFIGSQPLSYYISLFCDACVPIFAFVSGYGLYYSYCKDSNAFLTKNIKRSKKLYIRYWVVLLVFAVLLGWILNKDGYPGDWQKFLLSFTGISPKYNGAWWYFTIYIAFIFTAAFWFKLLDVINPYLYLSLLVLVYVIAFYFRVYHTPIFENSIIVWLHTQSALYFCTLLQFMLGAFALKYDWYREVFVFFRRLRFRNLLAILGIVLLIILHSLVPNFIVAPFTALAFIFLFLQIDLSKIFNIGLDFFTPHSTNLWLIHMFFYMIYFEAIIYAPQYPILIFTWLVLCCVFASFIINLIIKKIENFI